MTDLPYARYKVEANTQDRGIGIAAKQTLNNYAKAQGVTYSIDDLNATSNHVGMIISFYPKGSDDKNIQGMKKALYMKGRMSSKEKLQPDFSIEPVPYEREPQKESTEDAAWEQAVEKLNADISTQSKSIKRLQKNLGLTQESLSDREDQISRLQRQLKDLRPREYTSPLEALVYTHLPTGIPLMEDIALDFMVLTDNNDLELTHLANDPNGFMHYVNVKLGTDFKSGEDLEETLAAVSSSDSWEKSNEGIELLTTKTQYQNNLKVLANAKKLKASQDVIDAIYTNIDHNQGKLLEDQIDYSKKQFEKAKKVEPHMDKLRKDYETLVEVADNCDKRAKANPNAKTEYEKKERLPMVMYSTKDGSFIYMPEADKDFQKRLAEYCKMDIGYTGGIPHFRISLFESELVNQLPENTDVGAMVKDPSKLPPKLKERFDSLQGFMNVLGILGVSPNMPELVHHEGHV